MPNRLVSPVVRFVPIATARPYTDIAAPRAINVEPSGVSGDLGDDLEELGHRRQHD
jgi:hypothetical protein